MRFRQIFGTLALVTSYAIVGCTGVSNATVSQDFHSTVRSAPETLRVYNPAGTIEVHAWNKPSVQVDAEKRGHTIDDVRALDISVQQGSTLEITSVFPHDSSCNCQVRYVIHAPASTNLDLHQNAGTVRVDGFTRDVRSIVNAGTQEVALGSLGGSQRVTLSVSIGTIKLSVPAAASANISASSSVGAINTDFPLTIERHMVGSTAKGSIGNGSAVVELTIATGAIHIVRE